GAGEAFAIVGEIEHGAAGGGEDGGAFGGAERGEIPFGGKASAQKIGGVEMHVVEEIGGEARGDRDERRALGGGARNSGLRGAAGGGAIDGESRNILDFSAIGELKIVLLKIADGVTL